MDLPTRLLRSPAVLTLLALQLGVFAASAVDSTTVDRLSLPERLEDLDRRPWSPVTVMLVHENVLHLAVMVLVLAAFGPLLEHAAGSRHVLAVYLLAGVAGSAAVLLALTALSTDDALVGSSAAVLGVAAAALAARPSSQLFAGTTTQWLAALVGINLVLVLSQPLSSIAHLAGLAAGFGYGRRLLVRSTSATGPST